MISSPRLQIRSLGLAQLEAAFTQMGEPAYRARQVLKWLYEKRVNSFEKMTDLPAGLRGRLAADFAFDGPTVARKLGSADTTRKFLLQLGDGSLIEAVLIPASPALYGSDSDRRTLCVSTQVGCAYGCKFCASGLDGFSRNLDASEIVEQILAIECTEGERINNLVFMGMGEPLANFGNVMRAISIINAEWGIGLGARHITVSTSGLVPQIRALAEQPLQIRLAVSLHGATDTVREKIMPVNRKYGVAALLEACAYYAERKKQRITFEYILILGVNDSTEQARELARHAARLGAKVNLIPCNAVDGLQWERPSERTQEEFLAILRDAGVSATIRREKGHDIDAACGQLRLQAQRDKSFAEQMQPG